MSFSYPIMLFDVPVVPPPFELVLWILDFFWFGGFLSSLRQLVTASEVSGLRALLLGGAKRGLPM